MVCGMAVVVLSLREACRQIEDQAIGTSCSWEPEFMVAIVVNVNVIVRVVVNAMEVNGAEQWSRA